MAEHIPGVDPVSWFQDDVDLVPVPRSSLHDANAPWPALAIASELVAAGLGGRVRPILRRAVAVRKAATAQSGQRPTARHHAESLEAGEILDLGHDVVLVDDVVTSGAQLLGAASCLTPLAGGRRLRGFAAIRTLSEPDIEEIVVPCIGKITRTGEATRRFP